MSFMKNILLMIMQQLNELIPSGANHYVVIMTFGYRTDDIAFRALMEKEFKYFGLLGSAHKIQKMFDDYRSEGINEDIIATNSCAGRSSY